MSACKGKYSRRDLFRLGAQGACVVGLAGTVGLLADRSHAGETVWQIDPAKCNNCGKCATNCVLEVSAVKVVHAFAMCGYCDICTGYFVNDPPARSTGAENLLCPTGAINRKFVEDPYYEYTIDDELCIGCGRCSKGCGNFGNGSLYLQIRHNRCVNCSECTIATVCPTQAIKRVPAHEPYIRKEAQE